MVTSA